MFFKKKKPVDQGCLSTKMDKIFFLENIRKSKDFIIQLFKFLRIHKENIGFLKIESSEITHVIMTLEMYNHIITNIIKLKQIDSDMGQIKEIIKQLEKEENESI